MQFAAAQVQSDARPYARRAGPGGLRAGLEFNAITPRPAPDCGRAAIVARRQRSWAGIEAVDVEMRSEGGFDLDLRDARPRLLFTVAAVGGHVAIKSERGGGFLAPASTAGPLSFVPADTPAWARGKARLFRQLALHIDIAVAASTLAEDIDPDVIATPRLMFADPCLSHLCQLFADECAGPRPMARLYGDSLCVSLMVALFHAPMPDPRAASRGGLAPWQMLRLQDYVDAHLADDLSLRVLAQLVGLSPCHLCRAFKQSAGLTLFEWLRRRRVDHAQQLLLRGDLSIAEVALEAGFSDQSHLTRAFGRTVGTTPAAWQRARTSVRLAEVRPQRAIENIRRAFN
jgi:AraC family transcriptional regulator